MPKESIQATQRRGNLLAISNLASLLKQQEDVITQSRKEIMDKYGLIEQDNKIVQLDGSQITKEIADALKQELQDLKPAIDTYQKNQDFVKRLATKASTQYKELQYREDLQKIADNDWKNQGILDAVS